ncbi:MAG: hypothetical protein SV966_06320 [Actinomycetota bacterium]|nr:hypothetical protein [Actinomycetota bacterium]
MAFTWNVKTLDGCDGIGAVHGSDPGVPAIVVARHERPVTRWRKRHKSLCLHVQRSSTHSVKRTR